MTVYKINVDTSFNIANREIKASKKIKIKTLINFRLSPLSSKDLFHIYNKC